MQTTSLRGPVSARPLRSSGVGKQSAAVKPYFGARNVVVRQAPPFQPDGVATPDTPAQKPAKDVPSVAAFGEAVRSMVGGGAAATQTWKCSILSSAPLKQEVAGSEGVFDNTGADLEVIIVDLATELRSAAIPVDTWHPPAVISVPEAGPSGATGWSREGPVTLPSSVQSPGAVLIRKKAGPGGVAVKDYISSIKLVSSTAVFTIPAESWVSSAQGWRVFFAGNAYLPQHTPTALVDDRQRELEVLRGNQETVGQTRSGADRIYWYQTYNDLGNASDFRPALGGTKALPYPRRLATNRGDDSRGSEYPPAKGEKPWLPYDEQFSFYKSSDFNGDTLASALPAALTFIAEAGDVRKLSFLNFLPTVVRGVVRGFVRRILGREPPAANFEDFADVLAMFKGGADGSLQPNYLYPAEVPKGISHTIKPGGAFKAEDGTWDFHLDQDTADELNNDVKASRSWKKGKGSFDVNDLFTFPVPKVLGDRPDAWYTDAEYGRQALAGQNPCALAALTVMPEVMGSSIREEHVAGELQGATLAQLVAEAAAGGKPRLFIQDYWDLSAFWEEQAANGGKPKGKDMVQHASRAIFYLQKDEATGADIALIPVAIELAHPDTHKENPGLPRSAGLVYARNVLTKDPGTLAVWRLAKAVHKSLDSAFHQLVSHWLRTHAVLEPFHIAMRRNMSALHPVSKLMLPHFRYTLNINCNARSSLINAGGIIEKNFSAGAYSLRLSSVVYGKSWTFVGQALPQDLADRGMVDPATGRPWTDYPYAEDGLQLWGALTSYFRAYLAAYYTAGDKDVLADTELQAWWTEVKEHGHPDLVALGLRTEAEVWGFAGPIPSVDRLVHVLATIAWLASGHHAAVNFGQYDFSSLILNASSLVRKPMPAPGSKAYKELVEAPLGSKQEGKFMEYLADPFSAVQVLATVKLLSAHAHDEHTLNEANMYLVDEAARKANAGFMAAMAALEEDIEARNADPARWTRYGLQPGTAGPLPYTLLMPSSGAGVTMRGVPYSVSI